MSIHRIKLFKKENKNIPVIVMIHTGNFISGSSKDVNGVELAKSLESIVVTLNYRLGILGFYSMDGHIKENIGVLEEL
jgi:carboxylesterase type B